MTDKIKPRMVDGLPVCSKECPSCYRAPGPVDRCSHTKGYAPIRGTCWPYYRAALAESQAECEAAKDEHAEMWAERNGYQARVAILEAKLTEARENLLAAEAAIQATDRQLDEARAEVKRLRKKIREDHPGIGLQAIAAAIREPMECGHDVDCWDEETEQCDFCAATRRADELEQRLEEAITLLNYSGPLLWMHMEHTPENIQEASRHEKKMAAFISRALAGEKTKND